MLAFATLQNKNFEVVYEAIKIALVFSTITKSKNALFAYETHCL